MSKFKPGTVHQPQLLPQETIYRVYQHKRNNFFFNSLSIELSLSLIFLRKNLGFNSDHKGLKNTTLLFTTFRSITPSSGNIKIFI